MAIKIWDYKNMDILSYPINWNSRRFKYRHIKGLKVIRE